MVGDTVGLALGDVAKLLAEALDAAFETGDLEPLADGDGAQDAYQDGCENYTGDCPHWLTSTPP